VKHFRGFTYDVRRIATDDAQLDEWVAAPAIVSPPHPLVTARA
jgi:hypothetical protein